MRNNSSVEVQAVRTIAVTEGLSLLLLLFVAVPAKHLYGYPLLVKWIGPVHGVLFLLYIAALVIWRGHLRWSWGRVLLVSMAASLPFASFFPWFHAPAAEAPREAAESPDVPSSPADAPEVREPASSV